MKTKTLIIGGTVVVGVPALLVLVAVVGLYALFHFPNDTSATTHTIVSSGQQREYLLYVPQSYDPTQPTPLIISLHPAMSWPSSEMRISHWNRVADENGFLVVYPSGLGTGAKTWYLRGRRTPSRMPDVVFISQLIDTLEAHYNIDSSRIYADGMSNGGGMAFALSCTLSHRIAAVGAVSAAQSLGWDWCTDSTPVPVMAFHGMSDPIVAYDGAGTSWLNPDPFPNVRWWVARWARRNRCAPAPAQSTVAADVRRIEYTHCADDATVVLYTIEGGGHQWPGGRRLPEWIVGHGTQSIDATRLLWAFYRAHPLRTR
jgi:polyhydroxybutyrate depolymerase